jgi:hypothetical protein
LWTDTNGVLRHTDAVGVNQLIGLSAAPAVSISAGWGSTATATVIGTDLGFYVRVTAGGTGIAANPTFTLTFATTYANPPGVLPKITGSNDGGAVGKDTWITSRGSGSVQFQFFHTPVSGDYYEFDVQMVGR